VSRRKRYKAVVERQLSLQTVHSVLALSEEEACDLARAQARAGDLLAGELVNDWMQACVPGVTDPLRKLPVTRLRSRAQARGKNDWIRGFAAAVAAINTGTAERRDDLIVAVVKANSLTLEQLEAGADAADLAVIVEAHIHAR
jgi:hypothetical protein